MSYTSQTRLNSKLEGEEEGFLFVSCFSLLLLYFFITPLVFAPFHLLKSPPPLESLFSSVLCINILLSGKQARRSGKPTKKCNKNGHVATVVTRSDHGERSCWDFVPLVAASLPFLVESDGWTDIIRMQGCGGRVSLRHKFRSSDTKACSLEAPWQRWQYFLAIVAEISSDFLADFPPPATKMPQQPEKPFFRAFCRLTSLLLTGRRYLFAKERSSSQSTELKK
jgi:hypothetical protein